jgi:hypothetical protein
VFARGLAYGLHMMLAIALMTTAFAEPESAVRRCADAAEGAAVEVCLRLAGEHPEQLEGIGAALRAHLDRAGQTDRALLAGLLGLLSEERAGAAAALAVLADPRAVPPLAHLAATADDETAVHAARALSAFPQALGALRALVGDTGRSAALRLTAVESITAIGTHDAAVSLIDLHASRPLAPSMRRAIEEAVEARWPELADQLAKSKGEGAIWLATGGGAGLGYALTALGSLTDSPVVPIGTVTGISTGVGAGVIIGRMLPISAGDAGFVATQGMASTAAGHLIGTGLARDAEIRGTKLLWGPNWTLGLTGAVAGYGLGAALAGPYQGTGIDVAEAASIGTASALFASSVARARDNQRPGPPTGAAALAGGSTLLAATATGHALAPYLQVEPQDALIGVTLALHLGLVGGLAPDAAPQWATAGASAGLLIPLLAANKLNLGPDVAAASVVGMVHGGLFGAGASALLATNADPFDWDGQARVGAIVGGSAGLGLAGLLAQRNPDPIDPRDITLIGLVDTLVFWQTVGWVETTGDSKGNREPFGWIALVPATVGTGVLAATPAIDFAVDDQLAIMSFAAWGATVGGVVTWTALDGRSSRWITRASLIGSDVGLASGIVATSLGFPPRSVALADVGGAGLGSLSTVTVLLVGGSGQAARIAGLAGAGAGLIGGAVAAPHLPRSGTRTRRSASMHWQLAPLSVEVDAVRFEGVQVRVSGW